MKTDLLTLLNEAEPADLLALPGIGPRLAERILAERPFDSLDDCAARVRGISRAQLERLADQISPPPAPEPQPRFSAVAAWEQTKSRAGRWLKAAQHQGQRAQADLESFWQANADTAITLRTLAWSLALALLLVLALVRVGNYRLERSLQAQFAPLQAEIASLQTEVAALRAQVATLEGIAGRTDAIASEQAALQEALDAMQLRLQAMEEDVARQARVSQHFEAFLRALWQSLQTMFTPGEAQ